MLFWALRWLINDFLGVVATSSKDLLIFYGPWMAEKIEILEVDLGDFVVSTVDLCPKTDV